MRIILTTLLFFAALSVFAGKPKAIEIEIDSAQFGISNQFSFKLILIDKHGNRSKLIPGDSDFRWEQVHVKSKHVVSFDKGRVVFNQLEINALNHLADFSVSYSKDIAYSENLAFPYVSQIHVLNNSFIINQEEALLLELQFQNKRRAIYNSSLFDLSQLEVSKPFKLNGGNIVYELSDLIDNRLVDLNIYSKTNTYLNMSKSIGINYPMTLILNFKAKSGEEGRAYQPVFSALGYSGANGENGKNVSVFLEEIVQNENLFLRMFLFWEDGTREVQIVQWSGAPIQIITDGGDGGNGGNGGDAQRYDAFNKRVKENKPGIGGNGGDGGDAGQVNVYTLLSQAKFDSYVKISSQGGKGGDKGKSGRQYINNNTVLDPRRSGVEGDLGQNSKFNFTLVSDDEKFKNELMKMGQIQL
jgi:hypothetical protein